MAAFHIFWVTNPQNPGSVCHFSPQIKSLLHWKYQLISRLQQPPRDYLILNLRWGVKKLDLSPCSILLFFAICLTHILIPKPNLLLTVFIISCTLIYFQLFIYNGCPSPPILCFLFLCYFVLALLILLSSPKPF